MGKKKHNPGRPDKKVQDRPRRHSGAFWTSCIVLALLSIALVAAYHPSLHGGMLWDDDHHLTRGELRSAQGLWRIWFDPGATQQYYPVTHSAFWIFHQLWGDSTHGYHLINVLLHAACAFLIALILKRLAVPWPWLAAVIFAFHPVHVESVAWMTELKNTLSGFFYLLAALAYLGFDRNRDRRSYCAALALFALALLTKSVTATLPAALLVVFWWQRGRLNWRRDFLPLAPFFVLGVSGGIITSWIEQTMIDAQNADYLLSVVERCLLAGRVVWFYLGKLLWPANLIFIYPRWQVSQNDLWQYLYPMALAALLLGLWLLRKKSRGPLAAMLFYCGTLFPVLGFLNVYPFRYSFVADHFQYLASIGVIALFGAGLAGLAKKFKPAHPRIPALALVVIAGPLAVLTWSQSRLYVDAETIYRATISRNPSCWMALNNLGMALQSSGRIEEAAMYYKEALRQMPDLPETRCNLGNALERMGRREEAVVEYLEALRLKADFVEALSNLGIALQELGRAEEAVGRYREALRLKPNFAVGHNNLAYSLQSMGRLQEAVAEYEAALRIAPDYTDARIGLSRAQAALSGKAIKD